MRTTSLLLLTALGLSFAGAAARGEQLAQVLDAARGGTYKEPTAAELRTAKGLFERTLKGQEDVKALTAAWKAVHFDLIAHREAGISLLILRESTGHKRGRGLYVFRQGTTVPLAVQAPHAWDDLHTGPIAARLVVECAAQAAAWNTLPRAEVDLAHETLSYFQSFTAAFARVRADGVVVQLHGFARKSRRTEAGRTSDMILSSGTKKPPLWVLEAARQLKAKVAESARVFPREVNELGATTNAQGALLRGLGHEGLLHVEMSLEMRKKLLDEGKVRRAMFEGISSAYQKERKRGR